MVRRIGYDPARLTLASSATINPKLLVNSSWKVMCSMRKSDYEAPIESLYFGMVYRGATGWTQRRLPAEGIEPTRSCDHWILSPAVSPEEMPFVENLLTKIVEYSIVSIMRELNINEAKVRRGASWQRYYYVTEPSLGGKRK